MNLREFVAQSLTAIRRGIEDAIVARDNDPRAAGKINPVWIDKEAGWDDYTSQIEFDVAVTAGDNSSVDAKGGIRVLGLELGGGGQTSWEQTVVSRVRFSVPMILPAQATQSKK